MEKAEDIQFYLWEEVIFSHVKYNFLFYHKQWIQCISNVSKIDIFLQWKNIVFFH